VNIDRPQAYRSRAVYNGADAVSHPPICSGRKAPHPLLLTKKPACNAASAAPATFVYQKRDKGFAPSPQQQAYFDWIESGKGSAVVIAVAGSGKTTTLVQGLGLMEGRGFFGAYNKAAAQEIRDRVEQERSKRRDPDFGKKFYIATVHAACFSAWRQIYPKVEVDDRKVGNLITRYAEEIATMMAP